MQHSILSMVVPTTGGLVDKLLSRPRAHGEMSEFVYQRGLLHHRIDGRLRAPNGRRAGISKG